MRPAFGVALAAGVALCASPALAGPEVALETTQGARAAFVHADDNWNYAFGNITWGMYLVHVSGDDVPTHGTLTITATGRSIRLNCESSGCWSKLVELKSGVSGHIGN